MTLVSVLTVFKFALVTLLIYEHFSLIQATDSVLCPVQVHQHFLTVRPTQNNVIVDSQCVTQRLGEEDFLRCENGFNGNYTWRRENLVTNYVVFELTQRVLVIQINLIYLINSQTQQPKVSFCALADSTQIDDSFRNLECTEIIVRPTVATETSSLELAFTNETNKIGMEVITQGIKADMMVTRAEFFGTCTSTYEDDTTSSPTTSTLPTTSAGDSKLLQNTRNITNGANPSHSRKTNTVAILMEALSLGLILSYV